MVRSLLVKIPDGNLLEAMPESGIGWGDGFVTVGKGLLLAETLALVRFGLQVRPSLPLISSLKVSPSVSWACKVSSSSGLQRHLSISDLLIALTTTVILVLFAYW